MLRLNFRRGRGKCGGRREESYGGGEKKTIIFIYFYRRLFILITFSLSLSARSVWVALLHSILSPETEPQNCPRTVPSTPPLIYCHRTLLHFACCTIQFGFSDSWKRIKLEWECATLVYPALGWLANTCITFELLEGNSWNLSRRELTICRVYTPMFLYVAQRLR